MMCVRAVFDWYQLRDFFHCFASIEGLDLVDSSIFVICFVRSAVSRPGVGVWCDVSYIYVCPCGFNNEELVRMCLLCWLWVHHCGNIFNNLNHCVIFGGWRDGGVGMFTNGNFPMCWVMGCLQIKTFLICFWYCTFANVKFPSFCMVSIGQFCPSCWMFAIGKCYPSFLMFSFGKCYYIFNE